MLPTSRPMPLIAQLLLAHLPLETQQPPLQLGPLKGAFQTQYVNAFIDAFSLHMSVRGLQLLALAAASSPVRVPDSAIRVPGTMLAAHLVEPHTSCRC